MAENPESKTQVINLDGQNQQMEAARLLRNYAGESQKIAALNAELNQQGKLLIKSEIGEIQKDIAECEKRRENLRSEMEQAYHAQTPRQLNTALKQQGIDFMYPQYDYQTDLPQQNQNQFQVINQQGAQNEARSTSQEKGMAALEAIQESMEHLKKAMAEAENAKRSYQVIQEETQKAFEVMQKVNFEMLKSDQLLMQTKGGQSPQQQHDNILHPEISNAFGTESVNQAQTIVDESLRNYQQHVQGSQEQSREPQDSSKSNPQAESSKMHHRPEKSTFERACELYGHALRKGGEEGGEYGFPDSPKRPGKGLIK